MDMADTTVGITVGTMAVAMDLPLDSQLGHLQELPLALQLAHPMLQLKQTELMQKEDELKTKRHAQKKRMLN
jgi:hypothetical protein